MRFTALLGTALRAAVVSALLQPEPRAGGDEPLAPEAIKPLTQIAKDVAKAGRAAELDELVEALQVAGMEAREAGKLAATWRADAAKVKQPAAKLPGDAKSLQQLATTLASRLDKTDEPKRTELARFVLLLDDQNAAAQGALGREKLGSEWLDAKARSRRTRRAEIGAALAKSRTLDVPIEVGRSDHPLLAVVPGRTPSFARSGTVQIHGVWPAEKLERVLRDTLRALAFDNFVITGDLALPELPSKEVVFLDSRDDYAAAVRVGVEKHWVASDEELDPAKCQWIYVHGQLLSVDVLESSAAAKLMHELLWWTPWKGAKTFRIGQDLQKGTSAGILNWTCLQCFGSRMAHYLIDVVRQVGSAGAGTASLSEEEQKIREHYRILADAGISGGRTWMRYLASHRQDPQISSLFVDDIGKLQGDELLKMTLVVEMLCEDGPLLPLLTKLPQKTTGATPQEGFEKACRASLSEFDASWRDWLLPPRAGLAERLGEGGTNEAPLLPSERQAVDALNDLRRRAGIDGNPVELDRESTDGCRKHLHYLARHPAQLTRWPDAHEEYSDQPDFDPLGAWAGTHAVIVPGVKDGRAAFDCWMSTFYHRVPLLDVGLVRIGFSIEGGTAVLDCGSFVREHRSKYIVDADRREEWSVVWPNNGATGVPTTYSSELPHPIPGEDESRMGYPVTLQLTRTFLEARPEIELSLHAGAATGSEVPCWSSTPTKPSNSQIVPDSAWCLIPKSSLSSGAQYTVTGTASWNCVPRKEVRFSWSFRCGH